MSVTRVFHEGCQTQWMWQAVCFRHVCPSSMMACFSVLSMLCHLTWHRRFVVTWMEIPWHDNLQGRAWRKMWRKAQRERAAKGAAKSAAKNAAKNAMKNSTAEKQLFGICHDCFHFGPGTLLATRFLDPFPRRSGSVAGSPSAQCDPLSNVMRLNVSKGFHPLHSWCCAD